MEFQYFFILFCCLYGCSLALPVNVNGDPVYTQPEQVHISATGDVTEMVITWVTIVADIDSIVQYGLADKALAMTAKGNATKFVDGGSEKTVRYIHRVKLTGLRPATSYDYHCGSMMGWSSIFRFKTLPEGTNWSPRLCLYGDLGNSNAMSLGYIQEELARDDFDAVLHVGDFAYDLASDQGRVGDAFMRQIVPIASARPYMTCPGNHEYAYNFSNYRNRFSMPGNSESLWYSWNVGPMHIISLSTEVYFDYLQDGIQLLTRQYEWLLHDLKQATSPQRRQEQPWIMVMGHRPMYCSDNDGDDCTKVDSKVRVGVTSSHLFSLEKLFYSYGVDLLIWAHEHNYERLFPIYDQKVYNGSYEFPFTNPRAPVHITTGSGGCSERHDPFSKDPAYFTAFRALDYGYSRMTVYNSTHLYWDQISIDQGGKVIDEMWLIKDIHGPYN
ncbi:acid phosphatase type 7-like [Dendronephthya gigantea]|uniref:acid phosphatase type 7-like n=1 Tax=Dendronephthya gigantea TaxID=151771 RepID=UPI00106C07FF|nr:acid phosphatase type 7-like [Dendronephthya gigantea]